MARQREFDKDEVIERAIGLFWEKGYEATSIRDLIDTMGISTSSMYEAFGNKRGIFLVALARFCEIERARIAEMAHLASTPQQFVQQLFSQVEDAVESASHLKGRLSQNALARGSLTFNTLVEFGTGDTDITDLLLTHYIGIADIVADVIAEGQTAGTVTNQEAPHDLAYTILSTLHGIATVKGVRSDFIDTNNIIRVLLRMLDV